MAAGRPWIFGVNPPIDEAVEGHRHRAGEDHAQEDSCEVLRTKGESFLEILPPRESRGKKRKGKRKQRVAEADHLQNVPQASQHENYERH